MLSLIPVSLREANEFVRQHHRHHRPTVGHKFSIGVQEDGRLAGVVICGRPVSRFLDDGYTLEVNRLCTDGTKNACSMLYGAAARAARAMGYHKIITYILDSECGTSLKEQGLETAWEDARKYFNRCHKCGKWVSNAMYNADVAECVECAPWEDPPRYCSHCGKEITSAEIFCPRCGKRLQYGGEGL